MCRQNRTNQFAIDRDLRLQICLSAAPIQVALEAQVFEHTRLRFRTTWTFVDDLAHFQYGPPVGDTEGKIQVLLDDEHRGSVSRSFIAQNARRCIDNGRLQAFRDLVNEQQARSKHEGAGENQHFLFAARQRARFLFKPLPKKRKIAEGVIERGAELAVGRARRAADCRGL